ncbi:MAG: cell wall metabolism sensor histidine kinase WalK, partial [Defluviitaleaceae bacterium]|nr:cell wall metabolism sensor histidine kinase WalK [Defluviitaleaceae bacterium]
MNSLKLKWVLLYLVLVFAIMIISGTVMLMITSRQESDRARLVLRRHTEIINDQVIRGHDEADFNRLIRDIGLERNENIESHILNANGATIASTVSLAVQHSDSAILLAQTGIESFTTSRRPDAATEQLRQWFNYAYPVTDADGEVNYVIFARMDAQFMYDSLLQQSITLVFASALALALMALMGFLLTSTLTEPIIMLTKKSKEIADGRLDQEIEVKSTDEIGQLAESFNHMVQELQKSIAAITSEKNKMEIIQQNMSDGVLAYDSAGALIHANASAVEMLNIDIESVPFQEMMTLLAADIPAVAVLTADSIRDTGFQLGDRFINASFTPYFEHHGRVEGLVIVLRDITRHKKLDDMRREFVANVSHEIRTPLTTVKSYTETLLNNELHRELREYDLGGHEPGKYEPDERDRTTEFLEIINSEADRMTLLVQDLLELTRFDSKQLDFDMQSAKVNAMINRGIRQNSVLAERKSQKISYTPPLVDFEIMCDPYRVNQVLTNIISNAIKYSPSGSEIIISAEERTRYYQINITDAGLGIPKDDLPRIFERFYRVDKTRSRAMGGTGLGLAIAKEIMDAHGGKIFAVSEVGRGTTMTVRFPK